MVMTGTPSSSASARIVTFSSRAVRARRTAASTIWSSLSEGGRPRRDRPRLDAAASMRTGYGSAGTASEWARARPTPLGGGGRCRAGRGDAGAGAAPVLRDERRVADELAGDGLAPEEHLPLAVLQRGVPEAARGDDLPEVRLAE